MEPITTYENVAAACEALKAKGETPSVRKVRAAIGGGSPNTVSLLLAQWKSSQVSVETARIQIDPRIDALIGEMVTKAVEAAGAEALRQVEAAKDDLALMAEVGRAAEEKIVDLEINLTGAQAQAQGQAGQIEALTAQLEAIKKESAERIRSAEEKASLSIAAANEATAKAQAEAEAARTEKAKTELRLEALPRLEADLERVRVELENERQARVKAERELAACGAKNEGAVARISDLQAAADRDRAEAARLVAGLEARISDLLASAQKERDQHSAALERLQDRLESERQGHAAAIAELQKPAAGKSEGKK